MGFKVITPPAAVLPLPELRLHLRIDDDTTTEDAMLTALLDSARGYAQHYTGRAIGVQTIELALDAFPLGAIQLPLSPVTALTTIKYLDTSNVEQTLSNTLYTLDDYGCSHWVLPAANAVWPITAPVANALKVRYTAGNLPATVRAALLLLVGHLYENRENTVPKEMREVPVGVHALLDTVKAWSV
jgi:uncharacterized phiE125 gp8 family phage protein